MHVCYLGPKSCPPKIGGIEVFVFEIGRRLASKGVEVTVLTAARADEVVAEQVEGMNVRRIRALDNRHTLKVSMIPGQLIAASRLKPDVLHANDPPSGVMALTRMGWSKVVFTVHGVGVSPSEWPSPIRQGGRLLQRIATRGADVLTVTDDVTATRLVKDREQVLVIPPGVDVHQFRVGAHPMPPGYDAEKINLLFAGRLTKVKGVDLLVEGVKLLPPEILGKLKITVIGDGPMAPLVHILAADLQNVTWFRYVPHSSIAPYFTNANLFIVPSRSEGLPISMLEAMSSGVPVISSLVGGIGSYFSDDHLTRIGSLTPKGIAEAIEFAVSNQPVVKRKARHACELVRSNFSWDRIAEEYLRIYQSISK